MARKFLDTGISPAAGMDARARRTPPPILARTFRTLLAVACLGLGACGGGGGSAAGGRDDDGGGTGSAGQLRFSSTALIVDETTANAILMVERVSGTRGAVTVEARSADDSASAGQDYRALATTVSFGDGDATPKSVMLAITDDFADEPDETLMVTLSNPTGGATLLNSTATITIRDDDVLPTAASLTTSATVKRLAFQWLAAGNATSYKLMRRLSPTADFMQVGADLAAGVTATNFGIAVHLYPWTGAVPQYRVDACNAVGCTPSNIVAQLRINSVLATGYIKASDTSAGAQFGSSVAASADARTVAVGAPFANAEAGAVYVYLAPVSGPPLARNPIRIQAPSAQAMHFGAAVALSEDGNTLVVGAPFDSHDQTGIGIYPAAPNSAAPHSGGVFVYSRTGNAWSATPMYIKASDADAGDEFGTAVALRNSVLVVGAPRQDSPTTDATDTTNAAPDSGAAYAFYSNAGGWAQAPGLLKAANIGDDDRFGSSVAVSRGGSIIVVGAPYEDRNGPATVPEDADTGAAHRFVKRDGGGNAVPSWNPPQRFNAAAGSAGDLYGTAVAVSADGAVFAVGAPLENDTTTVATDAGSVYVYTATAGLITDVARLNAKYPHADSRFGSSLALNAGGTILAAGAPNESASEIGVDGRADAPLSSPGSGAVDVLVRQAGANWSAQGSAAPSGHYLKAVLAGAQDMFGVAVCLSDDGNTAVVGASGEDGNGTNIDSNNNPGNDSAPDAGAAYLF